MRGIAVVALTHKGFPESVARLLLALNQRGAEIYTWPGTTDVALCRNLLLGQCLERSECETIFLLDDDIEATPEQVEELCKIPEGFAAQSGAYILGDGRLAAFPLGNNRWKTGLGFFAVRASALRELDVETFEQNGKEWKAFSQAGVYAGRWRMDDESFCRNLLPAGGVAFKRSLAVGHQKMMLLWPPADGPSGSAT